MTQVLGVEHLAEGIDKLTKVVMIGGTRKRGEYPNQTHELTANQAPLASRHHREYQVQDHDSIHDDDAHQEQVV